MESKFLSENALALIEQYRNFKLGEAVCSIPYYNNKALKARVRLKAQIGKGSPKDIIEEVENVAGLDKIDIKNFDNNSLKKFLIDKNIGIDCSGFAFHVLSSESESRGKKTLDHYFHLSNGSFFQKIRNKIRPIENTSVSTFADEKNSKEIKLSEVQPGDMITMVKGEADREHILVIHKVTYENSNGSKLPKIIYYSHSIAWPTDGEYGHGVREGQIEITNPNSPIIEQKWFENGKSDDENYTFSRARKSQTTLRRLLFL